MNSQLPKKILNFFKQHWIWIVGVLAGIFYGLITRWGAIVGFDSYYYLASAQGIKDGLGIGWMGGDGVFVPLSHYPPIYPLVVAFISFISGTTILHAARIIAILAVTIAVVCTGYMVYCQTRCWFFTVLGMALFIIPGSFSVTLISAMSEGLFLALLCGFLLTLVDCCDLKSNLRTGIQVVLIAAMILVRFAAVTVLAAYLIALVLDERYRLVNRIKVALLSGSGCYTATRDLVMVPHWDWRSNRAQFIISSAWRDPNPAGLGDDPGMVCPRMEQAGCTKPGKGWVDYYCGWSGGLCDPRFAESGNENRKEGIIQTNPVFGNLPAGVPGLPVGFLYADGCIDPLDNPHPLPVAILFDALVGDQFFEICSLDTEPGGQRSTPGRARDLGRGTITQFCQPGLDIVCRRGWFYSSGLSAIRID